MSNNLEALKLAVQTYSKFVNVNEDDILACAKKYGIFITGDAGATPALDAKSSVNPTKLHLDPASRKR